MAEETVAMIKVKFEFINRKTQEILEITPDEFKQKYQDKASEVIKEFDVYMCVNGKKALISDLIKKQNKNA